MLLRRRFSTQRQANVSTSSSGTTGTGCQNTACSSTDSSMDSSHVSTVVVGMDSRRCVEEGFSLICSIFWPRFISRSPLPRFAISCDPEEQHHSPSESRACKELSPVDEGVRFRVSSSEVFRSSRHRRSIVWPLLCVEKSLLRPSSREKTWNAAFSPIFLALIYRTICSTAFYSFLALPSINTAHVLVIQPIWLTFRLERAWVWHKEIRDDVISARKEISSWLHFSLKRPWHHFTVTFFCLIYCSYNQRLIFLLHVERIFD